MREKLIEIFEDLDCNAEYCKDCEFCDDIDGCVRRQKEIIADRLIANDVVQVVRCKDCKHYMTIHCTCDGCCISGDWYCADGERKDND